MNENNDNPLGRKIRLLRQKQGLNQGAVAAKLGISIPAYSKIETGITDVNVSRLNQLAELYAVTVPSLIYGDKDPYVKSIEEENSSLRANLSQRLEDVARLQAKCIDLMDKIMSKEN